MILLGILLFWRILGILFLLSLIMGLFRLMTDLLFGPRVTVVRQYRENPRRWYMEDNTIDEQ